MVNGDAEVVDEVGRFQCRVGWLKDGIDTHSQRRNLYQSHHWQQGCSGAGDAVGQRHPHFSTGGTRPPLLPLFWTEIGAKVSSLLQLVTY